MKIKDVLILVLIDVVFTNIFAYLDYDGEGFNYIIEMWHLLLISILVFIILPIILLLIFKKSKYRLLISCLGFSPLVALIIYLL